MYGNALKDNLLPRLSLLRTALLRRFIYHDVVEMARSYGVEYRDVVANVEPFEFVQTVLRQSWNNYPDFSQFENDSRFFAIGGWPVETVSETSVARFIGKLVFELNARSVIELGSFSGWTSAHIALALHCRKAGGRLYCVELQEEPIDALKQNIARYDLTSEITILRGSSLDKRVLEQLPSSADLIFLDTSHTYPATRDEILMYLPRLSSTGCFVLHDSISAVGVRKSLAEIPADFRRMTFATEAGNGVTVLAGQDFFPTKRDRQK